MLTRAMIVLLLVLNLGVALWWALRAPPAAPDAPEQPLGVVRLQMPGEPGTNAVRASTAAAAAVEPTPSAGATAEGAPAQPTAPQCFSFGPYSDAAALTRAEVRLQPLAQRVIVRPQRLANNGWRVYLPPFKSREDVMAAAQRVADAGFDDYQVIGEGPKANALALGRYSSEDAARKRANALQAAGFSVRVEALAADKQAGGWVDVRGGADFDPAKAQAQAGAPQRRALDCATLK